MISVLSFEVQCLAVLKDQAFKDTDDKDWILTYKHKDKDLQLHNLD